MKNRILFLVAMTIMIIGLLSMGINRFVAVMPDWTVRIIGFVIIVDLAVLAYSYVRIQHKSIMK